MPAIAIDPRSWRLSLPPAGVAASLLLHALLLAAMAIAQLTAHIEVPPVSSVEVDLISVTEFSALLGPVAPPPQLSAPVPMEVPGPGSAEPAVETPDAPSNGPFRATTFYAGGLLAEPASARLRQQMKTLATPEQVVQLCDIEAMEQVRRARPDFDPDMVVPYAMAETEVQDGQLVATGGAFRSRREWYEISFRCRPAGDRSRVEAFEFTLGAAIPQELWEAHYLTAEETDE